MQKLKKLPIGIENFAEMQTEDFYLVDKTAFIKELLENWGKVNLFTRPRRFGKSMNMSMLKTFFEIGCDARLFEGLEISREEELCRDYMGKYPVISITLKGVEGLTFDSACGSLRDLIGKEAMRFSFLETSGKLTEMHKAMYRALINVDLNGRFTMSSDALAASLKTLSLLLAVHYGQKVILLIDEYDVPLDKADQHGYYEQMVSLLRKFFGNALKTNEDLQFAVMTGCLRVSKESIFTGLNNLKIASITNAGFDTYFGFTDREVRDMLEYYGFADVYESVKEWYDGYLIGRENIYCPWDVVNYCQELKVLRESEPGAYMVPKNYWVNTSGNAIIKTLLTQASGRTRIELEQLMAGEILEKRVEENLTYHDLYDSIDHIWSVLFATGYLTCEGITEDGFYRLRIPNREIRNIFVMQIMKWFEEEVRTEPAKLDALCEAALAGDVKGFEDGLNGFLKRTISIRDTFVKSKKENFYHGILLGLLGHREDWFIKSNAESGDGYSDILLLDEESETGIVIEIKYAESGGLKNACRDALRQIEEKHYEVFLQTEGMEKILKYGIAFFRKKCMIMRGE
ncbi:AAA family ATPase [Roseburia hominis]